MSRKVLVFLAMIMSLGAAMAVAEVPYTEGTVWSVTFVRTEANHSDDYLVELSSYYKKFMEAAKKEGLILSYRMLKGAAANEDDFDLMLMIEFKNMAALDGQADRMDALQQKLFSSEQRDATIKEYAKVREILGNKLMREIYLK